MLELNQCYNMDCMEGMAQFPDGFFDLAVVDPPYFSGPERRGYYGSKVSKIGVYRDYPVSPAWEIPGRAYFDELRRVSKHYIVWGCNYFNYEFAPGRIVWDKCKKGTSFSDCELAATDIFNTVRLFRFMWNGMLQGNSYGQTRPGRLALPAVNTWMLTTAALKALCGISARTSGAPGAGGRAVALKSRKHRRRTIPSGAARSWTRQAPCTSTMWRTGSGNTPATH